jgi:effector-binding domain-containing protein/uncharacterized membrane protein
MNYLKRTVLVLLLFLLIIIIISLFLPSSLEVERKIIIDADKEQVFKQVNDLKNWKNWSSWVEKDPSIYNDDKLFSEVSNGVGATFSWSSEHDEVGSGKMEITQSNPNEYIENSVDFGMGEVIGKWSFKNVDVGVEVVWGIQIDFGFNPFAKFFGMFMEDKVTADYELGLQRLKSFAENLPKIHQVKVVKERMENDLWYLSIRDTIDQMEMNNVHGKAYAAINKYMDEQGVASSEPPLVIYHLYTEKIVDIELGVPVLDSTIVGKDKIKMNKIVITNVVSAVHYGSYDRLPETYFGINEWMRKNKVVVTGPPWESYITDPATEPNPEKWETAVYFPIE